MKIQFLENRQLSNGRKVEAGDKLTVSTADGEAFIKNGVAKSVKPKKEVKTDG